MLRPPEHFVILSEEVSAEYWIALRIARSHHGCGAAIEPAPIQIVELFARKFLLLLAVLDDPFVGQTREVASLEFAARLEVTDDLARFTTRIVPLRRRPLGN